MLSAPLLGQDTKPSSPLGTGQRSVPHTLGTPPLPDLKWEEKSNLVGGFDHFPTLYPPRTPLLMCVHFYVDVLNNYEDTHITNYT